MKFLYYFCIRFFILDLNGLVEEMSAYNINAARRVVKFNFRTFKFIFSLNLKPMRPSHWLYKGKIYFIYFETGSISTSVLTLNRAVVGALGAGGSGQPEGSLACDRIVLLIFCGGNPEAQIGSVPGVMEQIISRHRSRIKSSRLSGVCFNH